MMSDAAPVLTSPPGGAVAGRRTPAIEPVTRLHLAQDAEESADDSAHP
ncbi:MAG: hypothetical protein LBM23_06375 [Propionibacteriaceae bacterium]|nr:hypothetical protein [Propionibacteriaceae bacterium]